MNQNWKNELSSGSLDQTLTMLYGKSRLPMAKERINGVLEGFQKTFGEEAQALFSAPGRTEIGGNHTDHQHGHVLAGSVDMDLLSAVKATNSGLVRIQSEGYSLITVNLNDLAPRKEEINTSASLIRGIAARMTALGCTFAGRGLDAYVVSDVPGGSGLSSSAAFEVLIGTIFNSLFWDGKATAVEIAQIGQYAENVFFGKPSGLMDQAASSVGGVVAIDFVDPENPVVERISLDLRKEGYALCILDSKASHADLTGEYAAVTEELKAVCGYFGKTVLRDIPQAEFYASLPALRAKAGDRAVLRAIHFYADDARAAEEALALKRGDFDGFLSLVRASGASSAQYLQNVIPTGNVKNQELMFLIALAEHLLEGRGAVRVHGGGFGGTAQAFVPLDMLERFQTGIEAVLGKNTCHTVTIRPAGGIQIA